MSYHTTLPCVATYLAPCLEGECKQGMWSQMSSCTRSEHPGVLVSIWWAMSE